MSSTLPVIHSENMPDCKQIILWYVPQIRLNSSRLLDDTFRKYAWLHVDCPVRDSVRLSDCKLECMAHCATANVYPILEIYAFPLYKRTANALAQPPLSRHDDTTKATTWNDLLRKADWLENACRATVGCSKLLAHRLLFKEKYLFWSQENIAPVKTNITLLSRCLLARPNTTCTQHWIEEPHCWRLAYVECGELILLKLTVCSEVECKLYCKRISS